MILQYVWATSRLKHYLFLLSLLKSYSSTLGMHVYNITPLSLGVADPLPYFMKASINELYCIR